ncbi:MAG: SDR family oxidoreductase [Flavobacteriales bacterium]|nr:SDR family oxidoreductase [Flavobacteriales bacterium]MCB9193543.1 SDR family oxidoreductase [Flavobacteriales bacterium]
MPTAERRRWSNWGNFPWITGRLAYPTSDAEVGEQLAATSGCTPRGNGRSYGDASLGRHMISGLSLPDHFHLDTEAGMLTCGAGMLLDAILLRIVPKGFFLPVTPGTRLVSIGGAVAADVHGKNHHVDGSLCAFVEELEVMTGDGRVLRCSRLVEPELFWSTCGGMGLSGMVLRVRLRLKRIATAYIRQRSIKCRDLGELFARFEEHKGATYSVAWVDLTASGRSAGRSILLLGEHAALDELPQRLDHHPLRTHGPQRIGVPFFFPSWVLRPWSVRIFNLLYNARMRGRDRTGLVHYGPYFHPLDAVGDWNRIYGRNGFIQYQFVVPLKDGRTVMSTVLTELRKHGLISFLTVLKRFGPGEPRAPLSFPMEGYTLSLDIPVRPGMEAVLERIDALVVAAGGRIYLAKDARCPGRDLGRMYPELPRFRKTVIRYGSHNFTSHLAERMDILGTSARAPGPDPRRVLVLGAGSDAATALARVFAAHGHPLVLAGRDLPALEALASRITEEHEVDCHAVAFDAEAVKDHAAFYAAQDPRPGIVVCAFGWLPDQGLAEERPEMGLRAITVNYTGAVSILEEAARDLEQRGAGCIIAFSSVAGDRGRASNYFYGSAKAGLTAYLSGLRNRLFASGVHVLTVKPGFMRTRMTAGMPLPGLLTADPDRVARQVYTAYRRKRNVIYTLGRWRWLMCVIRLIPEGLFKRLHL